jgi:hypothetical protein
VGSVVLHIGRPKAGSSSIQAWLGANVEALAAHGVQVATFAADGATAEAVPTRRRTANAAAFGRRYQVKRTLGGDVEAFVHGAVGSLGALADRHGCIVVSSEGLAGVLDHDDEVFSAALERLATGHEVQVVVYVRPQHAALEASWCQWGFRSPDPPSTYLGEVATRLHYEVARARWSAAMPSVRLVVRAFRGDLLRDSDVVTDFARHGLGVDTGDPAFVEAERVNVGLTLAGALLLRTAPEGFWSGTAFRSGTDNQKIDRARDALRASGLVDASAHLQEAAAEARRVLHASAFRTFEAGNHDLVTALAWDVPWFIEPVDERRDLAELDAIVARTAGAETRDLFAEVQQLMSG